MSRRDAKTDSATEQLRRFLELPRAQFDENPDLWTMASSLARAQAAGAYAFADALALFAETSLKFGERTSAALIEAAGGAGKREGTSLDGALNDAMSLYLDYVRELSALPGLVGMSFFDRLDRMRAEPPAAGPGKER